MDLGDWLRGLGLGRYEAAFRENEINEKVLPSLTAEDLKDLGVFLGAAVSLEHSSALSVTRKMLTR
jgi:SAM domain (Sterile alpha motif)